MWVASRAPPSTSQGACRCPRAATGAPAQFSFRVLGPDGQPVTRYTATHEKDLHLIVVRRDLSGFQHVHPTLGSDGTWSIPLRAAAPGQYRVFADFQPAGRDDGLTLGVDVPAAGLYQPAAVPPPANETTVDGYRVTLAGDLVPGTASKLTLTVHRDGAPVADLQPYLGASGHLVALRDGDLAYVHVPPRRGDHLLRRGPLRRHLPPLLRLQARRSRPHRILQRRRRARRFVNVFCCWSDRKRSQSSEATTATPAKEAPRRRRRLSRGPPQGVAS